MSRRKGARNRPPAYDGRVAEIVGVHGAFHQFWGPNQLRSRWLPAVRDGLARAGRSVKGREVAVAFYGDLFRPTAESGRVTDEEVSRIAAGAGLLDFLEDRFGEASLETLYDEMGREHLRQIIAQLGRYFQDDDIRRRVQERLESAIDGSTRVVVAHSMGSVVAYEALLAHPEWGVDTFVTLGSPIAGEFNRTKLRPPVTGEGTGAWPHVRRWVNVQAVGDTVIRTTDTARWFPGVEDVEVDNGPDAHRAEPYLNAAVTGRAVAEGLSGS